MKLIAHRKNTLAELRSVPTKYGVEIDIRSYGDRLVLQHEPFTDGELIEDWLKEFRHDTLILNVKEEGLETRLRELMDQHAITDYFFLDQSFPFLVKDALQGRTQSAVRISEFESVNTALRLTGKVDWVWVDCFNYFPLTMEEAASLQQEGFKLCLVSPELQGRDPNSEIPGLFNLLTERQIMPEAICTKHPAIWEGLYSI